MAKSRAEQLKRERFAKVARDQGIKFGEIVGDELDKLESRITTRYVRPGGRGEIWEKLAYPFCYHRGDDHSWRRLGELVPSNPHQRVIVWPDYAQGGAFVFSGVQPLVGVLSEALWSELLVTDPDLTFMLVFSDHRIMYAQGSAMDLLDNAYGVESVALVSGPDI